MHDNKFMSKPNLPPTYLTIAASITILVFSPAQHAWAVVIRHDADRQQHEELAAEHPEAVKQLLKVVEEARSDVGDHDRAGEGMRFFDPYEKRPERPNADFLNKS